MTVNNRKRGEIMKNNQKGFTLIELLVVIAIIGLLSTLAVVSLNSARTKARDARRMSDLKQISTAVELFSAQNSSGTYPAGSADCSTGVTNTGTNVICAGNAVADGTDTFLSSIPDDPDGTSHYTYDRVDDNNYCISADLETDSPDDFFKCENGACGGAAAGC